MMTATFTRLKGDAVTDRIDPTYYRPEYLANEMRLRNSGLNTVPLSSLVRSGRRAVYFHTSTLENGVAPPDWCPFLTADDFGADGFFLDTNARRRVAPEFALRYPNGALRGNELLVKVKGPNQITAYNECEPNGAVLVSGTIWGALVRQECVDPYYLVAALSCEYAATARTRLRTNLNVEFLSPADLLSLDLPLPRSTDAQKYIGDKVRQATRLHTAANELLSRARATASKSHGGYASIPLHRTYRTSPTDLTDRADSWFYNPRFRHAVNAILSSGGELTELGRQSTSITNGATPKGAVFGDDGVPWIRGKDFDDGDIAAENLALLDRRSEASLERSRLVAGDLLLSIKGTVGEVAVVDELLEGSNINQDIACIRLASITDAHYLALFLESELGQTLMAQQIYGAINAFFSLQDLRGFRVPELTKVDHDMKERLASMRAKGIAFRRVSKWLSRLAKLLIEFLIDGKLTEGEIIEAQQSVEHGDATLDRAILERLRAVELDNWNLGRCQSVDALYDAVEESLFAGAKNPSFA